MERIKQFYIGYERYITTGAFALGFIIDNLTLTRIDLFLDNIILFSYLLVAAVSIVVISVTWDKERSTGVYSFVQYAAPLSLQFAFGGLFSGFFIFYSQSAALAASWPFILVLLALLVGNEFLRKYYSRLVFQITIFFFVLFSFLIFYMPILVHAMGAWVFLLSGAVSLLGIALFLRMMGWFIPAQIKQAKKGLYVGIGAVFLLINTLYFTNIIPPIPLSLKEAGVFYHVERVNGSYQVLAEEKPWYALFRIKEVMHKAPNDPVYVFSAVFAPTDLRTQVIHEWQFYDEVKEEWTTTDRFSFSILGGRDGGYRGYTQKSNIVTGTWRVNIKTDRGQLIGRKVFEVREAKDGVETEKRVI